MLQFCVSQQINETPFTFKSTNIHVYSLEEALYHVFHYWRESVDDFISDEMITWVSELGLSYIASKMKELTREEYFTKRLLDFLQLTEYFSTHELDALHSTLKAWEARREWEKLKERADFLVRKGEPAKGLPLYKRALQFEENAGLLNNMAVACMQISASKEALNYLTRALALAPKDLNIHLHYIEAAILSKHYEKAEKALEEASNLTSSHADIPFFYGLMAYGQKNYIQALHYYEQAITLNPSEPYYIYKIADVHKTMRQYEKALQTLSTIKNPSSGCYVKEAEIHSAAGDIPAALGCIRKAASADGARNANLLAKLAEYYRNDHDWPQAESAISKAVEIAPDNDSVRLENARIKKGLGRTREYQAELTAILKSFKERYRATDY